MATATSGSSSLIASSTGSETYGHHSILNDPCYKSQGDAISYTSADSPVTLTAALSGQVIYAASGDITFNLPACGTVGASVRYTFVSGAAGQTITINPNSSDKILGGGKDFTAIDGGALTWTTAGAGEYIDMQSGTDFMIQRIRAYSWSVAAA